jgi:hypothetical protein
MKITKDETFYRSENCNLEERSFSFKLTEQEKAMPAKKRQEIAKEMCRPFIPDMDKIYWLSTYKKLKDGLKITWINYQPLYNELKNDKKQEPKRRANGKRLTQSRIARVGKKKIGKDYEQPRLNF